MAEQNRKRSRASQSASQSGRQPISRHPLFPAVVALWCAGLFGLGSLAIRSSLLEAAVLAAHVDAIVPAAAPPLGMTARILLALAMAGIGGVMGAAIARRIARPKHEPDERPQAGFAAFGFGRKSAAEADDDLAAEAEAGVWAEHALLPGSAPQILSVADFGLDGIEAGAEAVRPIAGPVVEPVSGESFCDEAPLQGRDPHGGFSGPVGGAQSVAQAVEAPPMKKLPRLYASEQPAAASPPSGEFGVQPADMDHPADMERAEAFSAMPADLDAAFDYGAKPEERIATADLDELSYVELLDRLALALQRRRERLASAARPVATASPEDFAAAPLAFTPLEWDGEEDEEALPDLAPQRQIITPSFASLADCNDVDDEDAYDEEEDDESEGAYSSLLDFSRPSPLKQTIIRIEEPEPEEGVDEPVVVFPSREARRDPSDSAPAGGMDSAETPEFPADSVQAYPHVQAGPEFPPADGISAPSSASTQVPEETERALREALATLQRMSGAA